MLTDSNSPLLTSQHLAECAILATRNDTVDNLNKQLLASMRGDIFTSYSVDNAVDHGDAETYATEYLTIPNLPPCKLKLKSAHRSFFSVTSIYPKNSAIEPTFMWPALFREI